MKQKRYANREIDVVNFYGDELAVVSLPELSTMGVLLVDICKSLEIDYPNQFRKVVEDENDRFQGHSVKIGGRDVLAIPISKLNAFLFSINPMKVSGFISRGGVDISKRELLIKYQDECAIVLHDYWMQGMAINTRRTPYLDEPDAPIEYGPVAASRPRLRRVMASFCDYAETECQYPINMDDLYEGLTNVFADYVPVPLIKDPSLGTKERSRYSGRDLWLLAIMENAASDALKHIQFKQLDVTQALNLVDEYILRTVESMGHHFIQIRSTFNHGNGIMG